MCDRLILLIGLCVGTLGQAPPLRVTSAPNTFDPNCLDKLNNCWDMPESNCRAPYEQWARDNCANRCGYCVGPTTPKPECKNKLSNCEAYDKSVCTNPDYTKWVADNCRYYCRMCTQEELARMDAMTTTVSPQNCKDKVDCRAYGSNACSDTFKGWSKDNCPNYCGYCVGLPTPPPACVDHIPNCQAYDADTCTNPSYKLWAEDNCKKFCGLCGQGSRSTGGGAIPITNSPNIPVPMTGHDTPVITYAPPTPPSPGKRHANVPPVKRQFHAAHHHSGQSTDKCWDSNDVDCDSDAPEKTKDPTNTTASTPNGDVEATDFPGSEYHPRPTPDKNWDLKPSTKAPETTKTKDMSSELTTDPLTTEVLSTSPTIVPTQTETSTSSTPDLTSSTRILVTGSTTESTTPEITSMVPPLIQSTAIPVRQTTEQLQTSIVSTETSTSTFTASEPSSTIKTTDQPIVSTDPSSTLSTGQSSSPTQTTDDPTTTSSDPPKHTSQPTAPPTISTADTTTTSMPTPTTPSTSSTATSTASSTASSIASSTASSTATSTASSTASSVASSSSSTAQPSQSSSPATPPPLMTTTTPPPLMTTMVTSDMPSPATVTQVPPTKGPVSSTSSVVLSTSSTLPTTTEVCEDTISNCADYGLRACTTALYVAWARAHCARFCEFCIPATLTPFKCENKIPNCREFDGGNLCTDVSYFSWARENCFAYCGFHPCGSTTQPMS